MESLALNKIITIMPKYKDSWVQHNVIDVTSLFTLVKAWAYIERIPYDHAYWASMKNKLKNYYFDHFISTAAAEFCT